MTDLTEILASLQPTHNPGVFAFCRLRDASAAAPASTIGWFREAEGVSVILPLAEAVAAGLTVDFEAALDYVDGRVVALSGGADSGGFGGSSG